MKATLELDETTARRIYPTAAPEVKSILENSFPKGFFSLKIEDRVKTFEDSYPIFMAKTFTDKTYIILQRRNLEDLTPIDKMMIFAEVLRDGWRADYNDRKQEKHYGWVEKTASGWVFDVTDYGITFTSSTVGPRFVQKNAQLAKYFVTQMLDIIIEHLTINY